MVEFLRADLGGIWGSSSSCAQRWARGISCMGHVSLPHCVNCKRLRDPELTTTRGPAWYRTQLKLNNPYANAERSFTLRGPARKLSVHINHQSSGTYRGYDDGRQTSQMQ